MNLIRVSCPFCTAPMGVVSPINVLDKTIRGIVCTYCLEVRLRQPLRPDDDDPTQKPDSADKKNDSQHKAPPVTR